MALEQKLHLRLSQKLVMTPTLQQAIKLLQLSRLELEQALAQELQVNPVLEMTDEAPRDEDAEVENAAAEELGDEAPPPQLDDLGASLGDSQAGAGELPGGQAASASEAATAEASGPEAEPAPSDPFDEMNVEDLFANYLHDSPRVAATWEDEEEGPLDNSPSPRGSLYEELGVQLGLLALEDGLAGVCDFVIGNLDPDGYLRLSDEDIAGQLGVSVERVQAAVAVVQGLEPPGIGARDLAECLRLQLDRLLDAADPAALEDARRLLTDGFDDFLHQRWDRLQQRLGLSREVLKAALEIIRRLNPRPGTELGPVDNSVVEPDVTVSKVEGHWRVTLNDEGFPRLRLSAQYVRLLQSRRADSETSGYLRERMRAALWFLRSVEQRQGTIMKVSEAIVRRQSEFLERGLAHLRPLVLRDIADDIGMHESTVSRVVANKYMATPRGVFPLKYFFHSAISHAVQGDISSVVVKQRIRELIEAEEAGKPLSDARVARQLNRLGIRIARRTVAKYREELAIPSSEQRRRSMRR